MAKKTKQQGKTEQADHKPDQFNGTAAAGADMDAVALLSADHRKVEELFARFQSASSDEEKRQIAKQACAELVVHTQLEEEVFYPACIQAGVATEPMDEAQVEHDGAKVLIADILSSSESGRYFEAKVTVLSEYIKHHVGEEEKADGIFAKARESSVDLKSIGRQLSARKQQIADKGPEAGLHPQFKSFELPHQQETGMSRQYNDQERDEQGRFESQDRDRSGNRGRGRYESSSRNDYDADRSYSGNDRDFGNDRDSGNDRDFSGNDRDYRNESPGYSGSSRNDGERGGYGGDRGRYNDDDNDRTSSAGGGGWYGDSQGNGRGSQQGWEERDDRSRSGGSNRNERFEDQGSASYGSSGRGRYSDEHDDNEGRGRGQQGGSYRNDRDEDYRQSGGQSGGQGRGWFGDSEGHARAGRQQGGGSSSRSQHTQGSQDRGSHRSSSSASSGRGGSHTGGGQSGGGRHSSGEGRGWHGDSAGHSAAARQRNR
jgi:hypothetical protein